MNDRESGTPWFVCLGDFYAPDGTSNSDFADFIAGIHFLRMEFAVLPCLLE